MYKKRIGLFCASILIVQSMYADNWTDAGKICAVAGTALLGLGGAMGLYNWLNESDEQLLRNVQADYQRLCDMYTLMVQKLESKYQIYTLDTYTKNKILRDINETLLYDFAINIWKNNQGVDFYRHKLRSTITAVHSRTSKLADRMRTLSGNNYYHEVEYVLQEMKRVINTIDNTLPYFELLRDYLTYHKTYFALFECEDQLRTRYEQELRAMTDYPNSYDYIRRIVKQSVMHCCCGKYPHVQYIEAIDDDMKKIDYCMRQSAHNYADRLSWSRWLYDSLGYIKSIIVAEQIYTDELRMRERECVEASYLY